MNMVVGETPPSGVTPAASSRAKPAANGHRLGTTPASSPHADHSRPKTPGSISAINDGRSLLANFRANKRNRGATPSPAAGAVPSVHGGSNGDGSSGPSAGKSTADNAIVDYLDRFQPRAPGLVRNLEAALDASVPVHGASDERGEDGRVSRQGDRVGVENEGGEASRSHRDTSGPNSVVVGSSSADDGGGNGGSSSGGGQSVATATATASTNAASTPTKASVPVVASGGDAAKTASKDSALKKDDGRNGGEPPAQLTPEMVRHAAQTSQAAFLSSVLPTQDLGFKTTASNGHAFPSPPVSLNGRHWSPVDSSLPRQGDLTSAPREAVTAAPSSTLSSRDAEGLTTSDQQAVGRWASMRRLQEQSVGLGSAADHQLTRALQLCRDLRGLKTGIGAGNLSGHERASRLEALQSTLHGLQEVLSKRALTEKASTVEAESLGGPAVVSSLLSGDVGNGGDTAIQAAAAGRVNGAKAETTASAAGGGWLSGSQLKAFEEQVQARSSMEIAALQSERRKLRSKVEMFQRQVQLLQREGASHSPVSANMSTARIGGPAASGEADSGGGFGSPAGEKRFADLLDARLGEERHLQATLEAELASLRGKLEEKDGLIGALREALRSAATAAENGSASFEQGSTIAASEARRGVGAESSSVPNATDAGTAVSGREEFAAPRSSDSGSGGSKRGGRGRYHSRSSRFLSAQGTAAAAAAGVATEAPAESNAQELTRGEGDRPGFSEDRGDDSEGASSLTMVAGGIATEPGTSDTSGLSNSNGGEYPIGPAAAASGTATVADGKENQGRSSVSFAGGTSMARRERNTDGDSHVGIISQATAVTGTALRMLWDSARLVGSRAGVEGGGALDSPGKAPRQRGGSSHAVLIL